MTGNTPKQVQCPSCKTSVKWSEHNPSRPFCSERCRSQDFIAWANEENILGENPDYSDYLSGDLPQ